MPGLFVNKLKPSKMVGLLLKDPSLPPPVRFEAHQAGVLALIPEMSSASNHAKCRFSPGLSPRLASVPCLSKGIAELTSARKGSNTTPQNTDEDDQLCKARRGRGIRRAADGWWFGSSG
jgi:hypothetical protein